MKVKFDPDKFEAADMCAEIVGGIARITFLGSASLRGPVTALMENGELDLVLERSAAHREIARRLGVNVDDIERAISS